MTLTQLSLFLAALTTGVMAGLFFAWSFSVTTGLARLRDNVYLETMQHLNREILNPAFFGAFIGSIVFLPAATILHYLNSTGNLAFLVMIATVIYFVGTIGITVFGNVPMNNALDVFDLQGATGEEISKRRLLFERRWNQRNLLRTISSLLAFGLLLIACIHS